MSDKEEIPYWKQLAMIRDGSAPKTTGPKPKTRIKQVSDKKAKEVAAEKEARGENDTELQRWYRQQMKYMSVCEETGMRLETKIYQYAIMSICHILPKATVKSLATHPLNRVFLLPDLHTKFDAMSWGEREKMGCWPIIMQRLISMYPNVTPEDRRHYPYSVLKWIEDNEPFK